MAEIKIEKKSPIWPWVLLGLIILAIVIYFISSGDETEVEQDTTETTALIAVNEGNETVAEYVNFVESDTSGPDDQHEYSNEALIKLTDATSAMADEIDYDISADIDSAREYTNRITTDPDEKTHANSVRKAADILANALNNMQREKYQELQSEAGEVSSAAESINPETPLLEQRDAVKRFHNSAAALLKRMN